MTEMVTTKGQVLQPLYCNRFGLGQGFYVATKLGQGQGISCHDKEFLCRYRVSWSGVATKLGQGQGILCLDRVSWSGVMT